MTAVRANLTIVTEFHTNQNIYILHSVLFSMTYLRALLENVLIMLITTLDEQLHTPMYFFLKNLSFQDLCLISITISTAIVNFLIHNKSISYFGCVVQVFLLVLLADAELFLLTAMSFDHYAANCLPLHYEIIMNMGTCMQMVAMSWFGGVLTAVMHTAGTFSLPCCGSNRIHQFFCDIPQLLVISCSENVISEFVPILISVVLGFCCFISFAVSYVYIFSTVKKIPSTEDQSKAYSTYLPHMVIVVLFLSSGFTGYLKPTLRMPSIFDLIISVFYTMVPPVLNPIIYSLKNKAMKMALHMLIKRNLINK